MRKMILAVAGPVIVAAFAAFFLFVNAVEAQGYKRPVKQHEVCVGTDPTYIVTAGSVLEARTSLIVFNNNASNAIWCSFDPSTVVTNSGRNGVKVGTSSSTLELPVPNLSTQPTCAAATAAQTSPSCTTVLQFKR
jgi:hypothetical protein